MSRSSRPRGLLGVLPAALLGTLAACASGTSAAPSVAPTVQASGSSTTPAPASTAASGAATESAPPGDIPDNVAFVRYQNAAGRYSFVHPEGWAQVASGSRAGFTDKLNGVVVDGRAAAQVPTPDSARQQEVIRLSGSVAAFELRDVSAVRLPAGSGVRITYRRDSQPDPVTGKVYRDEVQEYLVAASGRLVQMDLSGPVGADNVDAYRTMSQSLVIR